MHSSVINVLNEMIVSVHSKSKLMIRLQRNIIKSGVQVIVSKRTINKQKELLYKEEIESMSSESNKQTKYE
jgi:hypothetical protein